MTRPTVLCVGYLSADRITTTAGTYGPVPGGAALYAALGARACGARVALAAAIGDDYPGAWRQALTASEIDLSYLEQRAGPTRTTDLRYDEGYTRRSPHFDEAAWVARTEALAPKVPEDFAGATVVTVGPVSLGSLQAVLVQARRRGVRLVADTSLAFLRARTDALLAALPELHIFAPSLEETRHLMPKTADDEAAILLAARGTTVLQKRGARGAFLVRAGERAGTTIAPVPVSGGSALDPTGAGDATLGAIAAHLAQGLDILNSAVEAMRIGARAVTGIGPAAFGLGMMTQEARTA